MMWAIVRLLCKLCFMMKWYSFYVLNTWWWCLRLIDSLMIILYMYIMMMNKYVSLMVLIMVSVMMIKMVMSCMNVCIWWVICSCIHKFWWLWYFNIQVEIRSLRDIISDIQVEIGYLYPSGDGLICKMTLTSKRLILHACRGV